MTHGRHFSLFSETGRCARNGCFSASTHFGYCKEHYLDEIEVRHQALNAEGKHKPKPDCFEDDQSWAEYEVMAMANLEPANSTDPCRDCTPDYQAQMLAAGRCAHPETVFVCQAGGMDVQGINSTRYSAWRDACMGLTTKKVLRVPPARIRIDIENKHRGTE